MIWPIYNSDNGHWTLQLWRDDKYIASLPGEYSSLQEAINAMRGA
jgi:hypothetical protein